MTIFRGTADAYARYRPPYPAAFLERLAARLGLDGSGRLLDLGCGTGAVFHGLARHFERIVALDVDAGMLGHARRDAPRNVHLVRMRAEDIGPALGTFRTVTAGASFHWMDRPRVARLVRDRLVPGGVFAVLGMNSCWESDAPWQRLVVDVIRRHLGGRRRAGSGHYEPGDRHERHLAAAGFSDIGEFIVPVERTSTLDEVVGMLHSTSFANRAVLGTRAEAFEGDLRRTLLEHDPSGRYAETVRYYAILGSIVPGGIQTRL